MRPSSSASSKHENLPAESSEYGPNHEPSHIPHGTLAWDPDEEAARLPGHYMPSEPLRGEASILHPLSSFPPEIRFAVNNQLDYSSQQTLQAVSRGSISFENANLLRVTTTGVCRWASNTNDDAAFVREQVSVNLMAQHSSWRIWVEDPKLTLHASKIRGPEYDFHKASLMQNMCEVIKLLHSIPLPDKIDSIIFSHVACLGKPLLLRTNLLDHFKNLNVVHIINCSDLPFERFCSKGLESLRPKLFYSSEIIGLNESSQSGTSRPALAYCILHVWRYREREFQRLNPGQQ